MKVSNGGWLHKARSIPQLPQPELTVGDWSRDANVAPSQGGSKQDAAARVQCLRDDVRWCQQVVQQAVQ